MEFEKKFYVNSRVPVSKMIRRSSPTRAIQDVDIPKLQELFDNGTPVKDLALQFGCSNTTVRDTLKRTRAS